MKKTILILILLFSIKSISQQQNEIRLSEIKLCELTLDDLKQNDIDLEQIILRGWIYVQMDL